MADWRGHHAVLFDCDGVLVDSNEVKSRVFAEVLEGADPERLAAFLARHRASGGVSRYEKLRWWYSEYEPVASIDAAVRVAAARFTAIAREEMRRARMIDGVSAFLAELASRCVPMWVISGGDQDEVDFILRAHGIREYFCEVLGSPIAKPVHFERLAAAGTFRQPSVYFGDAALDMELAERHRLNFVYVAGRSDWGQGRTLAARAGHLVIEDFRALV